MHLGFAELLRDSSLVDQVDLPWARTQALEQTGKLNEVGTSPNRGNGNAAWLDLW